MLEGGRRHEEFDYPDTEWLYYSFAERFGWTPNQVDNLPAGTADWLIAIGSLVDKLEPKKG